MLQIIPKIPLSVERPWQKELADVIKDPASLLAALNLDPAEFAADMPARQLFPVRVPRPYLARIKPGDKHDPLLLQVLTRQQEFEQVAGYQQDPLQEQDNQTPGILHKYQSRALLIVRGACAINCRYCFRRHFPYGDNHLNKQQWQQALEHIRQDQQINEVILSGGDPLMANDDFLSWLVTQIEAIDHVRRLRIHTRLPVVIPSRICRSLLDWISATRLQTVMVLHINHGNEIDAAVTQKCQQLREAGVTMLNQAVLLKDINDNADTLATLSEALFAAGILPYYLHLLDKVEGAHHFDVQEAQARQLMETLIGRLPGFLVPRLVREIAGKPGKTPVDLNLTS